MFQISPLATSLSTLNTSGAHGPLPHTVSNLLDILKSCIEAPDVEPHPTEGATEDESEDTSFEPNGSMEMIKSLISLANLKQLLFLERTTSAKFVCHGMLNMEEASEDSLVT